MLDGLQEQFISNQPSPPLQGQSNLDASSRPIFSMYSEMAQEEDNKMTERWQKDADGILIFVSPRVVIHTANKL